MRRAKAVLICHLWAVQLRLGHIRKIDSELLRYQAELSYVPRQ